MSFHWQHVAAGHQAAPGLGSPVRALEQERTQMLQAASKGSTRMVVRTRLLAASGGAEVRVAQVQVASRCGSPGLCGVPVGQGVASTLAASEWGTSGPPEAQAPSLQAANHCGDPDLERAPVVQGPETALSGLEKCTSGPPEAQGL